MRVWAMVRGQPQWADSEEVQQAIQIEAHGLTIQYDDDGVPYIVEETE